MLKEQEKCYKIAIKLDGEEISYSKETYTHSQARYNCLKTIEKLNSAAEKAKEVFRETSKDFWSSSTGWVTLSDKHYIENVLKTV